MRLSIKNIFIISLSIYIFFGYETITKGGNKADNLTPMLPLSGLYFASGPYGRQILGDMLFIKSAIYYGGKIEEFNSTKGLSLADEYNLSILSDYLYKASMLNPKVIDFYYRSQAILSNSNEKHIKLAIRNLSVGLINKPESVTIPFFQGYNYKKIGRYKEASEVLMAASNIKGAPKWIRHLAISSMAHNGSLDESIMWLTGMMTATMDAGIKRRYRDELKIYKISLSLQNLINKDNGYNIHNNESFYAYLKKEGLYHLIVEINKKGFELTYNNGHVSLFRSEKTK